MRKRNHILDRGLSLLELMLVVMLVAIIASIVMVRISDSTDTAKCRACQHNRAELNAALERYGVENGSFPIDLTLLNAPEYFPAGVPTCPVTGATYAIDPGTQRISGHTSTTVPGDH